MPSVIFLETYVDSFFFGKKYLGTPPEIFMEPAPKNFLDTPGTPIEISWEFTCKILRRLL